MAERIDAADRAPREGSQDPVPTETTSRGRKRVVHVTTALSPSGAGVHEAVRGIVEQVARGGAVEVGVVGLATAGCDPVKLAGDWPGVAVTCLGRGGVEGFRALLRHARTCDPRGIDLVHAHGLWDGATLAGSILADRAGCPLVVATHGMLADWAFRHRAAKKALPWLLWERRALAGADVLEAKSATEVRGFVARGLRNRAEVIPVGLEIPPLPPRAGAVGPRECLFLSRIHPVKGIDILLRAWARARPAGWRLVVAGPDAEGYEGEMKRLAEQLGLGDAVAFVGPKYGGEKWGAMRRAELFVLPSHTENFGLVVAEALAMEVPCITTTGTPWADLPRLGLGWCVDAAEAPLAGALREATALPPEALGRMGGAGRRFVAETFSWDVVRARTLALYDSLLGDRGG